MDKKARDYEELFAEINAGMNDIVKNFTRFEQHTVKKNNREGLSVTEAHIIEQIGIDGGRSMGEVTEGLGITKGTLTVAVKRLESKGYIVRRQDARDKRVVLLHLTRRGIAAFRLHLRFHRRMVEGVMKGLSEHECRSFVAALKTLNSFLEENQT